MPPSDSTSLSVSVFAAITAPLRPGFSEVLLLVLPLRVPRPPAPRLRLSAAGSSAAGSSAGGLRLGSAAGSSARLGSRSPRLGLGGGLLAGSLFRCRGSAVSPCSSSWRIRASITPTSSRIGAANRPTIAVTGPATALTSWARRISAGGSFASCLRSSAPISAPSSRPPLSVIVSARTASSSAFATATGSPSVSRKAIAVGPSRRASSGSIPADSAARFVSEFLTTEKRAPCSSSFPRSSPISVTVRPR